MQAVESGTSSGDSRVLQPVDYSRHDRRSQHKPDRTRFIIKGIFEVESVSYGPCVLVI